MVIVKILGGLGNQLFQYAAGRALALKTGAELKLDVTGFDDYALRNFELDKFNLNYSIATKNEVGKYKAATVVRRLTAKLLPSRAKPFYKEPFFHFDENFFCLRPPVYVQGYFQSEKYFGDIDNLIREEFLFKEAFPPQIESLARQLRNEASVSIHLRRGDYKNAESLRVHGILPTGYYQRAIDHLRQKKGEDLQFYLFSDDPRTALKDLNLESLKIVSGRVSKNHYEDFYLMQQCRYNVIANSSFSWWAAWLNNNPDKKVIAPIKWFGEAGPKDTQDLAPTSWSKI